MTQMPHRSGKAPLKVNWLDLELELMRVLNSYAKGRMDPESALSCIDESIGFHTGRGYQLPHPEIP